MLYACHLRLILITIDETNQVDELCWVGGGVGGKGKALGDNICIRTSGIRFTVICCYKDGKKLFKIDRYNVWTEIFKTLPLNFQLASDFDVNSNY